MIDLVHMVLLWIQWLVYCLWLLDYVNYMWWDYNDKKYHILTIIGGVMSRPLGVLAQNPGSLNSIVNISQTRRPLGVYHISTETSFWGESNDRDLWPKLNDLTYQKSLTNMGHILSPRNPNPRTWVFNHLTV